jgi:hypothetical protein
LALYFQITVQLKLYFIINYSNHCAITMMISELHQAGDNINKYQQNGPAAGWPGSCAAADSRVKINTSGQQTDPKMQGALSTGLVPSLKNNPHGVQCGP